MKRFFILTALLSILGLTACEKETADAIIGTWKVVSINMEIGGLSTELDIEENKLQIEFSFEKDGKGSMHGVVEGEDLTTEFTYTVEGDVLKMVSEGEEISTPITIDGKNMTMVMNGEFLDMESANVTMNLVKK